MSKKPILYTMIHNCVLTAHCLDCRKEHTGNLGVRLMVIGGEPGFELVTCDLGVGADAHPFAKIRLAGLGVTTMEMPKGKN